MILKGHYASMVPERKGRLDRLAISAMLAEGRVDLFFDYGVTPQFFQGDYAALAEFLFKHFRRYSALPPVNTVVSHFPWFKIAKSADSMEYYADRLRERELFFRMNDALLNTRDAMDRDGAAAAYKNLSEFMRSINVDVVSSRDMHVSKAVDLQVADYQKRQSGDFDGITTGFQLLDKKILCYENTDLIVIAAPPRSGKTWYLTQAMRNIAEHGYRVLFFSKEMKRRTIMRRLTALTAQISYKRFRHGSLEPMEEVRFRRAVAHMRRWGDRFIIIGDDGFDGFLTDDYDFTNTLEFVESKILQYKPDIVAIDGFYLMSVSGGSKKKATWEQIMELTRKAKRMCNRLTTPIVLTTQLNREAENSKKANLSHLSFAYSIGMDADIVQFMMRDSAVCLDDEVVVSFPKIREEEDCGAIVLKFNPAECIDFVDEVTPVEMDMVNELGKDSD